MRKKIISFLLAAAVTASCFTQTTIHTTAASVKKETLQTTSPYTNITYTHSDAFHGMNIYNGIDVSKYNTNVNWEKVKAAGIDFVFIRLGYRGYGISGKLCADTLFESHITGALSAGLKVGVYYFTQALNTTEAKEEADYCIEKLKGYNVTLPIVLDYEFPNTGNGYTGGRMYDAKLTKAAATNNCKAFCDTIKDSGYTPMIYANKNDLTNTIDGSALGKSYNIWLANYNAKSTYTGTYQYWQYTEKGTVDGISGYTDCNFYYTGTSLDEPAATPAPSAKNVSISKATAESLTSEIYTGKAITPSPVLTYNGQKLTPDTDYKVSYTDNKQIGKATITITGLGNYTGTKKLTFTIRPAAVKSFSATSTKQTVSFKWKQNKQATGYQIWRKSTYNSETYEKIKTFKYNTKLTYNDTKLEADHEYYYRIRSYTTVNDKKYYSDYVDLTVSTLPAGNQARIAKKTKLYALPDLSGKKLVTIPKSAVITYLGRTFVDEKTQVYHLSYIANGKAYTGYAPGTAKLTFQE